MGNALPPGWYADPADGDKYRYWAGDQWTLHVRDRSAVDRAADRPLPDFDIQPATAAPTDTGRRRRRLPVLLVALALAAVVATAGVVNRPGGSSGSTGHTMRGEVRVDMALARGGSAQTAGFRSDGTRCGGGAGPGVGIGSPVTVRNARGEVLGEVNLAEGRVEETLTSTTCVFPYAVDGIDDAELYEVRVAQQPATRATRAMLASSDWRLDLRVG